MDTSIEFQILFLLYMLITGCIMAFLYDLIRVSRIIIRTPDFIVCSEDIIFFILSAIIIFAVAFEKNSGKIQVYDFIALFAGVVLYILIIGNKLLNFLVCIINFFIKIIRTILKIVFFPFKIIAKIFKKPCLVIIWRVKSANRFLKLYKNRFKNRIKATKISIFKK